MMAKKGSERVFHVTIVSAGHPSRNGSLGRFEDKNAIKILSSVIYSVAGALVGDEKSGQFVAETCYYILKDILKPGIDIAQRVKDYTDEKLEAWTLVDKSTNVQGEGDKAA